MSLVLAACGNAGTCKGIAGSLLRKETITSSIYGQLRTIRVLLPTGYDRNLHRTYPVLYLFHGQYVLPDCADESWLGVEQTVKELVAKKRISPLIVVGIDSQRHRSHEYLPYVNRFEEPNDNPIGQTVPEFLAQEVMPFIARKYRVSTDPAQTGIGGVSNGAVAALYRLLQRPDLFRLGLFESPMLQDGNGQLVRDSADLARVPDRVYIGIGTEEVNIPGGDQLARHLGLTVSQTNEGLVRLCQRLAENLKTGAFNRSSMLLVIDKGAHHDPKFWRNRFAEALQHLYR